MINLKAPYIEPASAAEELILSLFWSKDSNSTSEKANKAAKSTAKALIVRQIHEHPLVVKQAWTYNTVATLLRRLEQKGYIKRTSGPSKTIVYCAAISYEAYCEKLQLALNKRYPKK